MATPELSRGIASTQPSAMGASASSSVADELRHDRSCPILWVGRLCAKWAATQPHGHLNRGRNWRTNARGKFRPSSNTLKDKLAAGRFVITAEITPPASFDAAELLAKALPLKGLADAVNVTDGAGARAHLGAVTAAGLLLQNGIEPILQFTCRDRNRIALQSDLMAAAALGIRNLLMLKGDDPKQGDQPDAKPVFDLDTVGADPDWPFTMRDKGELPHGRKLTRQSRISSSARPTRRSIRRPAGSRRA